MDYKPELIPSQAKLDPLIRLGAAVIVQARADLRDNDPIKSLDALEWILSPDIHLFLEALEIYPRPESVFEVLLEG